MKIQNSTLTDTIAKTTAYTYNEEEYPPILEGVELFKQPNWNFNFNTETQTNLISLGSGAFEFPAHKMLSKGTYISPQRDYFRVLQKWEGHVLEVDNEVFLARLIPISGQEDVQEAEIYLTEVTEEDRDFLEPGAVFYWSIGYLVRPSGTLRASVIRFRRLPAWTEDDLRKAEHDAHRWGDLFSAE